MSPQYTVFRQGERGFVSEECYSPTCSGEQKFYNLYLKAQAATQNLAFLAFKIPFGAQKTS